MNLKTKEQVKKKKKCFFCGKKALVGDTCEDCYYKLLTSKGIKNPEPYG